MNKYSIIFLLLTSLQLFAMEIKNEKEKQKEERRMKGLEYRKRIREYDQQLKNEISYGGPIHWRDQYSVIWRIRSECGAYAPEWQQKNDIAEEIMCMFNGRENDQNAIKKEGEIYALKLSSEIKILRFIKYYYRLAIEDIWNAYLDGLGFIILKKEKLIFKKTLVPVQSFNSDKREIEFLSPEQTIDFFNDFINFFKIIIKSLSYPDNQVIRQLAIEKFFDGVFHKYSITGFHHIFSRYETTNRGTNIVIGLPDESIERLKQTDEEYHIEYLKSIMTSINFEIEHYGKVLVEGKPETFKQKINYWLNLK